MCDQQHSKMTNITLTGSPGQDYIHDHECPCVHSHVTEASQCCLWNGSKVWLGNYRSYHKVCLFSSFGGCLWHGFYFTSKHCSPCSNGLVDQRKVCICHTPPCWATRVSKKHAPLNLHQMLWARKHPSSHAHIHNLLKFPPWNFTTVN